MDSVKGQITDFIAKCEEVRNCKFIMATGKIKDVLKSIVNSAELYELFSTVTANFNYPAEKQKCLVEDSRCRVVLPDTVGERLAFIFCLLVEFDRNDMNFNAFLQKYYPKDGSFYSSYHMFCDEIIGSLESIICDIYSKELQKQEAPVAQITQASESVVPKAKDNTALLILLETEREALASLSLAEEDRESANEILSKLTEAVKLNDASLIKALAYGYNYFVLYTGLASERLEELFEMLGAIVGD
ncbi:MAG: hypothetical protein ACI4MS_00125 [Candidatus Coproplasma sp.]